MALDRFIYWKDQRPTKDEVLRVIYNFFGSAATSCVWMTDRFVVCLDGISTPALLDVAPGVRALDRADRFIEVQISVPTQRSSPSMDIITRQADDYTNACADGLAGIFARYWGGKLEDG